MNEIVEEWYQFDIFLNMLTHYEELDEKIGSALLSVHEATAKRWLA